MKIETNRILFVCTGNICRSPMAEGIFRRDVDESGQGAFFTIDSAGTHGYHVGEAPDRRAIAAARNRRADIAGQRARRLKDADFEDFDLILAMDEGHESILRRQIPASSAARIRLFLDFAPETGRTDVPDPYYGGQKDFEYALDLIEMASKALINHLKTQ